MSRSQRNAVIEIISYWERQRRTFACGWLILATMAKASVLLTCHVLIDIVHEVWETYDDWWDGSINLVSSLSKESIQVHISFAYSKKIEIQELLIYFWFNERLITSFEAMTQKFSFQTQYAFNADETSTTDVQNVSPHKVLLDRTQ
jgi:hypothetical protein